MTDTLDLFEWAEAVPPTRPKPLEHAIEEADFVPPDPGALLWTPGDTPLLTLRDYQQEAGDLAWHLYHGPKDGKGPFPRQLIVMGTGAGKTVTFADMVRRFHPGRTLILTDQRELIDQAVAKVRATTGIFADVEQGQRFASTEAKCVVATVQTMKTRIAAGKYPPDHFALVVCDECDRAVAPQWQAILNHFDKHAKVLGVTATPDRADKRDILEYFRHLTYEMPMRELMIRGYLSRIVVRECPLKIDISDVQRIAGDLNPDQLGKALEKVFGAICEMIKTHAGDRKRILVFNPLVVTSKRFTDTAQRHGLNAAHIDGSMTTDERNTIKRRFADGETQVLSNPLLLGRGYDEPAIDCIINLRATESRALYQQIVGRGTRIFCPHGCNGPCQHAERKQNLLLLDFLWQFKGLGPLRPGDLVAPTRDHAAVMTQRFHDASTKGKTLELLATDEEAAHVIEEALVRQFAAAAKKKKKHQYFDALEWAANMGVRELVEYESPDAETEPPTKGQISELKKAGFVLETVKGRDHADKILAVVRARREAGLASFKQVHWLRIKGYRDSENWTREHASKVLASEFGNRW